MKVMEAPTWPPPPPHVDAGKGIQWAIFLTMHRESRKERLCDGRTDLQRLEASGVPDNAWQVWIVGNLFGKGQSIVTRMVPPTWAVR